MERLLIYLNQPKGLNVTREQLIDKLRKDIRRSFNSNAEAADYFGITQVQLSKVYSGVLVKIPDSILEWVGYKLAEPNYVKVKK